MSCLPNTLRWRDLPAHSLHSARRFWVWRLTFPSNSSSSTSQNSCWTFCALTLSNSSSLQEETELLSVDNPVVELCVEEPGHELWASVGVRLPLDEKDEGDSLSNLSMAFCTFLVKFVGKGSLLFSELCFLSPSESPLPITISPRLWLLSHRPGREPRALGSTVRWLPEPFPRGAEAAARPGIPGTSAPRPPSPEPRAPLALRPRGFRDPRARRDAASGAGGAHGRGGSRGSRHSFPLRTLRSSGGWVPQRGLPTLPSFLSPASAATAVGRMVASTLRPFPPSPARTSGKAGH